VSRHDERTAFRPRLILVSDQVIAMRFPSHKICLTFHGGPLDGHAQTIDADDSELIDTAAIPINENVFRMLEGLPRGPARPSRTFAVYELRRDADGRSYQFLCFRRAADLNAESWCV
jgi:hypothetical protein